MAEFLEFVLKQLVEYPDEVLITPVERGDTTIFNVELRDSDVGRIIGKNGQTIIAIRNLLTAAADKHGRKAHIEVIEDRG